MNNTAILEIIIIQIVFFGVLKLFSSSTDSWIKNRDYKKYEEKKKKEKELKERRAKLPKYLSHNSYREYLRSNKSDNDDLPYDYIP